MTTNARSSNEVAVGDPDRALLGRGVKATLILAVVFIAFIWCAKEVHGLYVHEPWQDDPYDSAVSFAIFFAPSVLALCLIRVPLCRAAAPLPIARAVSLLAASRLLVGIVLVTFACEWVSVAVQAHRDSWNTTTAGEVATLALLSCIAAAVALAVRQASRTALGRTSFVDGPDWLADASSLARQVAARLGLAGGTADRSVDWVDRVVVPRIRGHQLATAGSLSCAFGGAVALQKALEEGYAIRGVVLVFVVAATTMFAFVVIAGTRLRIMAPGPLSFAGLTRVRGRALRATLAGCIAISLALAFRESLRRLVGAGGSLLLLLVTCAAIAGATTFLVETAVRRRAAVRRRRSDRPEST